MKYFAQEARRFLEEAKGSDPLVVLLSGDLGAGKTTFVQALLSELGYQDSEVQSPTFLKLLEYKVPDFGLCLHIDSYRMQDSEEFERLALETYSEARAWFVEWPELFEKYLKEHSELRRLLGISSYWELELFGEEKKVGPILGPGGRGGEDIPTLKRGVRWSRKLMT